MNVCFLKFPSPDYTIVYVSIVYRLLFFKYMFSIDHLDTNEITKIKCNCKAAFVTQMCLHF